jgi:type I restriction enzyme S subunit
MSVRLDEVADFLNGGAWNQREYCDSGIPVVKVTNLKNETVDLDNVDYLPESSLDKYQRHTLFKGDLVVATVGSHPNLVASAAGRAVIIPSYAEGALLNQNALCIRTKSDRLLQEYLGQLGKSPAFQDYVKSVGRGAANQVRIALGLIKEFKFELPSPSTQRKIASILSAYDDLIENNLKRIKLLEEKAFLSYKEILRSEKTSLHSFAEVADYVNGYPFKPDDWKTEGLPIIKIKELKAGVQNETPRNDGENIHEKYLIENKDILFAWSASIGAYLWCSGKSILNQHIFNVKPFEKDFHNWLYFSLVEKIPDFINLSNGATMQHIKKSALSMVFLPVPEKSVYSEFQKASDPILNLIINLHQQNDKLREARDILLPRLMSGDIVV